MPIVPNNEVVNTIFTATEQQNVDWRATGTKDQYAASFGGKWTVIADKYEDERGDDRYWIAIRDSEGQELLRITDEQNAKVPAIFELARRKALNVDAALAELLKELKKPQT